MAVSLRRSEFGMAIHSNIGPSAVNSTKFGVHGVMQSTPGPYGSNGTWISACSLGAAQTRHINRAGWTEGGPPSVPPTVDDPAEYCVQIQDRIAM